MNNWISKQIGKASWLRFLAFFAALIPIQQAMTSLKWGASTPALALAAISLIALVIAALIGFIRKRST